MEFVKPNWKNVTPQHRKLNSYEIAWGGIRTHNFRFMRPANVHCSSPHNKALSQLTPNCFISIWLEDTPYRDRTCVPRMKTVRLNHLTNGAYMPVGG